MRQTSPMIIDHYHLTMAYGYWQQGKADQPAVFELFFRDNPFKGNYAISCGLGEVIRYLRGFKFGDDELEYLTNLKHSNDDPLFSKSFLDYLRQLKFTCDVDAVPEGSLIFAREPMLLIKGPLLQCQLLETALVNLTAFSTLVATKASRICSAAKGDPIIELGLRRAQGPNGGLMASRAAYIGGCEATSNVVAGKEYDIPVKGTMSHSWVMSYPGEFEAFKAFADIMKGQTILLLDTYNTMRGIKNAVLAGIELRRIKHDLFGVRLDSGNVAKLSKKVRKELDKAGFKNTKIIASGDLDEHLIKKLKSQSSVIDIWGVGTKLVSCFDQPALSMVFKMMAINDVDSNWQYTIKISDQASKTLIPGIQQIRRFYRNERLVQDLIFDSEMGVSAKNTPKECDYKDLLRPIIRAGEIVYNEPSIHDVRKYAINETKSFINSKIGKYKIDLDSRLIELQCRLKALVR